MLDVESSDNDVGMLYRVVGLCKRNGRNIVSLESENLKETLFTLCPTSRLDMISLPVDCTLQASIHKMCVRPRTPKSQCKVVANLISDSCMMLGPILALTP